MKKAFIIAQLESKYDVGVVLQLAQLTQKLTTDITVIVTCVADDVLVQSIIANEVIQLELSNPTANICSIVKDTDFILLAVANVYAQHVLPSCVAKLNCPYIENVTKITDRLHFPVTQNLSASCKLPKEPYAMTIVPSYFPVVVPTIKNSCKLSHVLAITNGESDVILVGGRGLGSKESFARLANLARFMSADIGATAGAIAAGYAPSEALIGVSGKSVAGKIYIGFGVSGAISHVLALGKAKMVIAINNDNNAAILAVADYAVIIDMMVAIEYFEQILADEAAINGVNKCT